jgi:hypothetical protein
MKWYQDEFDEDYDELIYGSNEDEEDEEELMAAEFFDVPLPYRPVQPKGERI